MTPEILCLGEPMVEFVRQDGDTYVRGYGGDTSNAAIAAARQGARVGYITLLGRDQFGDALHDLWRAEGVDATLVGRHPTARTGVYFVEPDPAGRHFTYYRAGSAASLMGPSDVPLDAVRSAKHLHLSGITLAVSDTMRAAALVAADAARASGCAVSLDTNLRLGLWDADAARAAIHDAATRASTIVTSIDDSAHLTGLTIPSEITAFYHDLGVETVVVTMGGAGSVLSTGRGQGHDVIDAAPSSPVDSTGAGDSFAGAFLAWRLETGDPSLAARRAAIVAAGTVSGLGAIDPIPRRAEVLATERRRGPGA